MDPYRNGKYSGANGPRINEPTRNEQSRDSRSRPGINHRFSKDSLLEYYVDGSIDTAKGSIYDAPSPSIPARQDWKQYQATCEDVTDEDLPSTPKVKVRFEEPGKKAGKHESRRQSTREQGTPKAKASTPVETRRSSTTSSPAASRKPSPAVDPFPRSVSWENTIHPDKVRSNAYNVLPSCRHWAGMTNLEGCHSAPVLGWDRGYFRHNSSVFDLSTCAESLPSGKFILPNEAYYNGNDASDSNDSSKGGELISGWWMLGHSDTTEKLRACTSCMSGLMAIVPEDLYRFEPMEPHEARNHKCHFSSLLLRFGWFLMLHKLQAWRSSRQRRVENDLWYMINNTLTLLGRAVYKAPSTCPNDNLRVGDWYSFPVGYNGADRKARFGLDFLICPQDYRLIISLFPWTLRFLDRVPADEVLMEPHLCSLRMDTVRWNELVYTMYAGCAPYDGTTPVLTQTQPPQLAFYRGGEERPWVIRKDTKSLRDLLTKSVPFDRCPRDNYMVGFTWFTIPELPQFTVCHHCYATVVLPLRRAGSKIAQAFLPHPQSPNQEPLKMATLAPPSATSSPRHSPRHSRSNSSQSGTYSPDTGSFCQLYSTRMRDIFNYVAATDPVPVSAGKAKDLNEQWQMKQLDWRKSMRSPVLSRRYPVGGSNGGSSGSRTPNDDEKHAVAFPLVKFQTFEGAFEYLQARALARYKVLKKRMDADKHLTVVEQDKRYTQEQLDAAEDEFEYWDKKWKVLE